MKSSAGDNVTEVFGFVVLDGDARSTVSRFREVGSYDPAKSALKGVEKHRSQKSLD